MESKAIELGDEPEGVVSQTSVDALVPDWAGSYTAWWVEWEGSTAARLRLERYVRGQCFVRAKYRRAGQGELHLETTELRQDDAGEDAGSEDVILSNVVGQIQGGTEAWMHRTDVAGRLVLAYKTEDGDEEGSPDVDHMVKVLYEPEPCTLRQIIRAREVPAKEIPAGAGGSRNQAR